MYQGKAQAAAELQTMADRARNDGETRTALFGMAVVTLPIMATGQRRQQIEKNAQSQKEGRHWRPWRQTCKPGSILEEAQKYDAAATVRASLQLVPGIRPRRTLRTTRSACITSTWRR